MDRTKIHTDKAPAAVGPYSQAIATSDMVYCAGQVGLDPSTRALVGEDIEAQTRQALTNLGAVLETAGSSLSRIVKTTVFLADMADFKAMNEVYATFFDDAPPARSTIAVKDLPLGARVEIEAIAIRG